LSGGSRLGLSAAGPAARRAAQPASGAAPTAPRLSRRGPIADRREKRSLCGLPDHERWDASSPQAGQARSDADPRSRRFRDCIACPPGVTHGFQNESLEPVYVQVMLGKGRPEAMGYADDELYLRRDAHLR
jgi:predicted dienelactone hydrolase